MDERVCQTHGTADPIRLEVHWHSLFDIAHDWIGNRKVFQDRCQLSVRIACTHDHIISCVHVARHPFAQSQTKTSTQGLNAVQHALLFAICVSHADRLHQYVHVRLHDSVQLRSKSISHNHCVHCYRGVLQSVLALVQESQQDIRLHTQGRRQHGFAGCHTTTCCKSIRQELCHDRMSASHIRNYSHTANVFVFDGRCRLRDTHVDELLRWHTNILHIHEYVRFLWNQIGFYLFFAQIPWQKQIVLGVPLTDQSTHFPPKKKVKPWKSGDLFFRLWNTITWKLDKCICLIFLFQLTYYTILYHCHLEIPLKSQWFHILMIFWSVHEDNLVQNPVLIFLIRLNICWDTVRQWIISVISHFRMYLESEGISNEILTWVK